MYPGNVRWPRIDDGLEDVFVDVRKTGRSNREWIDQSGCRSRWCQIEWEEATKEICTMPRRARTRNLDRRRWWWRIGLRLLLHFLISSSTHRKAIVHRSHIDCCLSKMRIEQLNDDVRCRKTYEKQCPSLIDIYIDFLLRTKYRTSVQCTIGRARARRRWMISACFVSKEERGAVELDVWCVCVCVCVHLLLVFFLPSIRQIINRQAHIQQRRKRGERGRSRTHRHLCVCMTTSREGCLVWLRRWNFIFPISSEITLAEWRSQYLNQLPIWISLLSLSR